MARVMRNGVSDEIVRQIAACVSDSRTGKNPSLADPGVARAIAEECVEEYNRRGKYELTEALIDVFERIERAHLDG